MQAYNDWQLVAPHEKTEKGTAAEGVHYIALLYAIQISANN
jgi:hypothetical protein